jgi:tetratricopeptide (TPR) repeat protein
MPSNGQASCYLVFVEFMKFYISLLQATAAVGVALTFGACGHVPITHVPPGQSVGVALAKKPALVRLPAPAPSTVAVAQPGPAVEPDLPKTDNTSRVAEAFSRGEFCMNAGKDDEAVAAFQEAVKIDPTFTEAWQRLAVLYEKKGDNKKALEAFRRSKKIASQ